MDSRSLAKIILESSQFIFYRVSSISRITESFDRLCYSIEKPLEIKIRKQWKGINIATFSHRV